MRMNEHVRSQLGYRPFMRSAYVVAGLAFVLLCSCTGTKIRDLPVTPSPATELVSPSPSPAPIVLPENEQMFLLFLQDITPELTENEILALDLGFSICLRVRANWRQIDLIAWTRWSVDQHPQIPALNESDAEKVIAGAKANMCRIGVSTP